MSNYPPGSETDPNAPWNDGPKIKECEDCEGYGEITIGQNGLVKECRWCKGSGEIEVENDGD